MSENNNLTLQNNNIMDQDPMKFEICNLADDLGERLQLERATRRQLEIELFNSRNDTERYREKYLKERSVRLKLEYEDEQHAESLQRNNQRLRESNKAVGTMNADLQQMLQGLKEGFLVLKTELTASKAELQRVQAEYRGFQEKLQIRNTEFELCRDKLQASVTAAELAEAELV